MKIFFVIVLILPFIVSCSVKTDEKKKDPYAQERKLENVSACISTTNSISLTWKKADVTEHLKYYKIFRSTDYFSNYNIISTSTTESYIDLSLKSGIKYFYCISALYDDDSETPKSEVVFEIPLSEIYVYETNWTVSYGIGQIIIDNTQNIWACNDSYIFKYSLSGTILTQLNRNNINCSDYYNQYAGHRSIAINNNNIYISSSTNGESNIITRYNLSSSIMYDWGYTGQTDGQFNDIGYFFYDSIFNKLYIVDTGNHRIQKFNYDGIFISKFGNYGTNNGQFNYPKAITIDSSGNIYVSDTGNNRIQKFDSLGNYITNWGTGNYLAFTCYISDAYILNEPTGITVDNNNNIYIVDKGNGRFVKYNSIGEFITKYGSSYNNTNSIGVCYGIAVDNAYNVYVSDQTGKILKYKKL